MTNMKERERMHRERKGRAKQKKGRVGPEKKARRVKKRKERHEILIKNVLFLQIMHFTFN